MKKWKRLLLAVLVLFAGAQLFNPARTNPPVKNDFLTATQPPAAVAASVRAACYDCHSHETVWPWYAHVAPVSWLIVSDTTEGREHLNLSDWPTEPDRAIKKLDRINEAVDDREMPPKKYTLIHANARLTETQRKEILDWTDAAAAKLRATTTNQ